MWNELNRVGHCALVWLAATALWPATGLGQDGAEPVAGDVYLFEGELTVLSGELAPTLREGQVLSGFFVLDPSLPSEDAAEEPAVARYAEVLVDGEFTFDLNHVLVTYGTWRSDTAWLTLSRGEPGASDSSDFYNITLPMDGEPFGEEGWRPRWFQLWLQGPAGDWLNSLEVQGPPETVSSGWFRVSYANEDGSEEATAEGPVTFMGPEGEGLSPTQQVAQLEAVVADLAARLEAAEADAAALRERLQSAENRVRGLTQTLDLFIAERAELQRELETLREQEAAPTEALETRIAELESSQALLEESREALSTINEELAHSLAARDRALSEARREIQRLEAERDAAPGKGLLEQAVPQSPHPFLAPGQVISGPTSTVSRPVRAEEPPEEPAAPETASELAEPEPAGAPATSDFRGPRKFRRGR